MLMRVRIMCAGMYACALSQCAHATLHEHIHAYAQAHCTQPINISSRCSWTFTSTGTK